MSLFSIFPDPFDLEHEMGRMFDRASDRWGLPTTTEQQQQQQQQEPIRPTTGRRGADIFRSIGPTGHPFDVMEMPDTYELIADAPGLEAADIHVELSENVLTITGKHKREAEKKRDAKVWRTERRRARPFKRSFALPDNVKAEEICASLDKGILTVCIPKVPEPEKPQPKQITVQSATTGPTRVEALPPMETEAKTAAETHTKGTTATGGPTAVPAETAV